MGFKSVVQAGSAIEKVSLPGEKKALLRRIEEGLQKIRQRPTLPHSYPCSTVLFLALTRHFSLIARFLPADTQCSTITPHPSALFAQAYLDIFPYNMIWLTI